MWKVRGRSLTFCGLKCVASRFSISEPKSRDIGDLEQDIKITQRAILGTEVTNTNNLGYL